MGVSISGDALWKLAQTKMLGIPVFLVLLILIFLVPFLSKYYLWNSTAVPEPKPGPVKDNAPSIPGVALIFLRTWIYAGFAGWIFLGAILFLFTGLIILQDLIQVLSSSRAFSFGIFVNNLLPIGAGWLLIISGGWSGVYFHKYFEGGMELIRIKFRPFWYALIAFSGFLLIILKYYIMGLILVFIAIGSLRKYISEFVRRRRPNAKAGVAGSRIFKDYEEQGIRNSK